MDLLLATRNPGKIRELTALLRTSGVRIRSLRHVSGVVSVPEGGRTFAANAVTKAVAAARATGCWALADDSGLEVDALEGAPGVRSARFAGRHGDDAANTTRLLRALQGLPPSRRRARYRCVLALASPMGDVFTSEGIWKGRIASRPRGRRGFGYDPVFLVPRIGQTAAELPTSTKNRLSHRAHATRHMRAILRRLARVNDHGFPLRGLRATVRATTRASTAARRGSSG